jgi:hypothetical protein
MPCDDPWCPRVAVKALSGRRLEREGRGPFRFEDMPPIRSVPNLSLILDTPADMVSRRFPKTCLYDGTSAVQLAGRFREPEECW